MDHLIDKNLVTIVSASGTYKAPNPPDSVQDLSIPLSIGYNMITVGSYYREEQDDGNEIEYRASTSKYHENWGNDYPPLNAPHVMAFGEYGNIPNISASAGYFCGTSFAAPFVTGSLAVLMQKKPELQFKPSALMAMVMASSNRMSAYHPQLPVIGVHDEIGAGRFNPDRLMASNDGNYAYFEVSEDNVGGYVYEEMFYANAGKELNMALCWLLHTDKNCISSSFLGLTNYDLYLYDSSNTLIASSTSNMNTETFRISVPTSGFYTVKIKQTSARKNIRYTDEDTGQHYFSTPTDQCGLAYYLI